VRKSLLIPILLISVFSLTPRAEAVEEYRSWLVPGLVASGFQLLPEVLEIFYSYSLSSDPQAGKYNSTAKLIFLESVSAIGANGLVLATALPLTFGFRDPKGYQGCSIRNVVKKTLETTMVLGALAQSGLHIAGMYQVIPLFNLAYGQAYRPQALTPTLATSIGSAVVSILVGISAVGTFVVSFCMASHEYRRVEEA